MSGEIELEFASTLSLEEREKIRYKVTREIKRRYVEEAVRYFKPKPYQNPFIHSSAVIDAVMGGNRSGKTITGAYRYTCVILGEAGIEKYGLPRLPIEYPKPPYSAWIVSQDFPSSREVVQPAITAMIPVPEIKRIAYREKSAIDFILLKSGVRVLFKSCDSGWRKFQGAEIPVLWFDEEPDEEVYKECMIRVGKQKKITIITMTPLSGFTWLVETIMDGANRKDGIYELHEYYSEDNDSLAEGELDNIKDMYPRDEWVTRLTGKPLTKAGLVYSEFRHNVHIYPHTFDFGELFEQLEWYFFCDYGGAMPMAIYLVAVDSLGRIYIHREHYLADATLEEHAAGAKGLYNQMPREADGSMKAGHEYIMAVIDPSAYDGQKRHGNSIGTQFMRCLIEAGVDTAVVKGSSDVDLGIELVKDLLKVREDLMNPFTGEMGSPMLFVCSDCVKWIWEIRRYRRHISMRSNMDTDRPRKKDDHAMDATRYGVTKVAGVKGGKGKRVRRQKRYHPTLGG